MGERCVQVNLADVLSLPGALVGTWLSADRTLSYHFRADGSYERHLHLALTPLCAWFAELKQRRRDWWLSYL